MTMSEPIWNELQLRETEVGRRGAKVETHVARVVDLEEGQCQPFDRQENKCVRPQRKGRKKPKRHCDLQFPGGNIRNITLYHVLLVRKRQKQPARCSNRTHLVKARQQLLDPLVNLGPVQGAARGVAPHRLPGDRPGDERGGLGRRGEG